MNEQKRLGRGKRRGEGLWELDLVMLEKISTTSLRAVCISHKLKLYRSFFSMMV